MSGRSTFIGIDIGGTKTAVVLGDETAATLAIESFPTDHAAGPQANLDRIATIIQRMLQGHPSSPLSAIGISCGGPLDSKAGVILGPPNLPGWDEVPVVAFFSERFGLPTHLENDANAGAIAEWQFGAGRGCRNVIFITAGTGLGCGLILDGRLYSGTNDMAGEAGHVRLRPNGPEGYGKAGSFEGFCSGAGLARLAAGHIQRARQEGRPTLLSNLCEPVTARHVGEAAIGGDPVARQILAEAGERLGEGLAILVDILNPEVIVLGSLAVRLGDLYLGPAREVVAREALARSVQVCRIVPARLGERTGEVAALCVAMGLGRD
ncbi:MAG: ROK family protein [Armatimonadetes bacterium]|jgi:glucokinase|nr:ROK family protein [Armatimonadota bacterium]MDI9583310.1 ROK family protein [Acidobacteriota bacterium]